MTNHSNAIGGNNVFLLGMHRSGTSALARALGAMGLWLGEESSLLSAHPDDNPAGYWERNDIHDAHVRYLEAKGYDWNRLGGFRVSRLDDAPGLVLKSGLQRVIGDLDQHRPWLVKDPRMCVLLPFWQAVVPHYAGVVAVRNPLEIAGSLRNTPRGVYSTPFLLLLWQKYMTRMMADLAGRPVVFVAYQRLLDQPFSELDRLRSLLGEMGVRHLSGLDEDDAARLFEKKMRRQQAGEDLEALSAEQRGLYEWLVAAATNEDPCIAPVDRWHDPDDQLAEFEASSDFFVERGRGQVNAHVVGRLDQLHAQNELILQQSKALQSAFESELDAARQQVDALQAKLDRVNRQRERLQSDLKTTQTGLDDTLRHVRNIESMLGQSETQREVSSSHAARLEQSLSDIRRSWSWRFSAPLRWPGKMLAPRLPARTERWLYRTFYRMPGLDARRKRALILWLHEKAPWLTRRTLSYQIHQASKQVAAPTARDRWLKPLSAEDRQAMLDGLSRRPLVSVIMPAYNTEPKWLEAAIASLEAQSYPNWQLCIADDASPREETRWALDALDDERIKVLRLKDNVGIAMASNAALGTADGEYVALLDHDDELAPDALLETVAAIDRHGADFVYTDEDKIDFDGNHVDPHFKPDFSPDLFLGCNYVCHLSVVRKELVERAGGFRQGFDGAQDYDLFLRCFEHAENIVHVPRILYHWRMHEGSTAAASAAKPKSWEAGRRALNEALERRGVKGAIELGPFPNTYRIRRKLSDQPLVSIIIPFRDKPELLNACIDSVLRKCGYANIEILAVDNGSVEAKTQRLLQSLSRRDQRIRVLRYDVPFNYSKINNWAAAQAQGDVLLFLNNDIEAITDGWISSLVEQVQRSDVAVVGARLLYPDETVQHGGVIAGLGGVAGHAHLNYAREHPGYFCRSRLNQNMSAVTFACAMVRKEVFEALGGLDEKNLTVAFNDVDFCLRAREQGYLIVYDAFSELYHHESKSRGSDNTPEKSNRFSAEIAYMQSRHARILAEGDPYYNVNLSLVAHSSFSIDP